MKTENAKVRPATDGDRRRIECIIKTALGYSSMDGEKFINRYKKILADRAFVTLVCEYRGEVVGFLGARKEISYEQDDEYIRILALAVDEKVQNAGAGGLLIGEIEAVAKENGIHMIALSSNFKRTAAHKFYESKGFEKTSYAFKKKI